MKNIKMTGDLRKLKFIYLLIIIIIIKKAGGY
jgi:hypothetical protein